MLAKDQKKKAYSLYQRMQWAKQAVEGMTWLHGANVIHRDFVSCSMICLCCFKTHPFSPSEGRGSKFRRRVFFHFS